MTNTIRGRLKIMIAFSLTIILLVGLLAVGSSIMIINQNSEQAFERILDGKRIAVDTYLGGVETVAKTIAYNKAIQTFLDTSVHERVLNSDLRNIVGSVMINSTLSHESILSVILFDENMHYAMGLSSSGSVNKKDIPYSDEAYFSGVSKGVFNPEQTAVFYYYLPVYSTGLPNFGQRIGSLVIILTTFELRNLLQEQGDVDTQFIVMDINDRVIATLSQKKIIGTSHDYERLKSCDIVDIKMWQQRYFVRLAALEESNWRICSISLNWQVRAEQKSIMFANVLLFLICMLTLLGVYIIYMEGLRRHIELLLNMIRAVPDVRRVESKTSLIEFKRIEDTFNGMLDKITRLEQDKEKRIKDTYALKLVASRWQIDALRRQLRPHFIYNTLEHLRGMALYSGNEELSSQLFELAQILRYDTRGGMYSVVADEIEMLSHYTHIMQARTGDRFRVLIHCDEELLSARIPRMMLQPLVENAFQHGLNDVLNGGQLDIDLKKSADGRMSITVHDNGVGMSTKRLEELKKTLDDVNINMADVGIGLISTVRRIKLMYKEKANYVLKSTLREGTTIQIIIPI